MSTVLLPMKLFVGPPPVAGGGVEEPGLPLGAWLKGALPPLAVDTADVPPGAWLVEPAVLPPFAVGVPALLVVPSRDELPSLVGAEPTAVLDDAATAGFRGVAVPATATTEPTTTAMATTAQIHRRANNLRLRPLTFRLPAKAERDDRRRPRARPPARRLPARRATDDEGGRGTCLCSLSAVASDPATWPDTTE